MELPDISDLSPHVADFHPDAQWATRICKDLPLDDDIQRIVDSPYVNRESLLLAQILRRLPR
jgi:hypothetical protein